jgi:polyisoprenoid-binding protein YceI
MFKHSLLFGAIVATSFAASAQLSPLAEIPAGKYTLDPTHASLTWRVNHLGLSNYTARFARMDATLNFDPKDPTKSTLVATVDPTSVKTDFPYPDKKDFDKELATGKDWFNATKFPEIKFESTRVEKTGENKGKIHGNLTFLGVTKPLVLDATYNGGYAKKPYADGAGIGFSATATLKRSDWGMANGIPMIGDEVQLLIETEFNQAK